MKDDRVIEAIEEELQIGKKARASVEPAHLKACNKSNWYKVDQMLELITKAIDQGLPIKADRYPCVAYGNGLSTFIPLCSRQGETDNVLARLNDKTQIKKIEEYALSRGSRIGGWEGVIISYCKSDENKKCEEKCFDLPTAVKKMTTMPSEQLGLKNCCSIVKDNFADIAIFNPNTVIDKATFTEPHQTAQGIEYVLDNGKIVINKGKHTGIFPGSVLS